MGRARAVALLSLAACALPAAFGAALAGSRRAVAGAAAAATLTLAQQVDPAAAAQRAAEAASLTKKGVYAFMRNEVEASVDFFDDAIEAEPRVATRLWQRGLSLFYVDRFEDAAAQFASDVAENPNDTEEAVWHLLARARSVGLAEARSTMLAVGRDPRPVMRSVQSLYQREDVDRRADVEKLAVSSDLHDAFYASLYLGLLAEAAGEAKTSQDWMLHALVDNAAYEKTGDYMFKLARVHALRRNLPVENAKSEF